MIAKNILLNGFIENILSKYRHWKAAKSWAEIISWLLKADSCKLWDIALSMGTENNKNYNTNLKKVERFLQSDFVEIGDSVWRGVVWIVFQFLKEMCWIEKWWYIAINIDFSSSTDQRLILSASIPLEWRYLPLYFSMRKYPKEKWKVDQKKMESAFIKELRHLLPKAYKYVIVADRWFWNLRFLSYCVDSWFDYILRTNNNRNIEYLWEQFNLKDLSESEKDMIIKLRSSKQYLRLVKSETNTKWGRFIFTNLPETDFSSWFIRSQYWQRFKIEKMFQDQKSSWFNIENSKLKAYSRVQRLFFLVYFVQLLTIMIWFVAKDDIEIKKKYPLSLNLMWVILHMQEQ